MVVILLGEDSLGVGGSAQGGRTPYWRMGDGRAVLRSSIREFFVQRSHARPGVCRHRARCASLAPQGTSAAKKSRPLPSSLGWHAALCALATLNTLQPTARRLPCKRPMDVIHRDYPDAGTAPAWQATRYAALLQAVSERTARLMAQWQAVGFCHGDEHRHEHPGPTIMMGPSSFWTLLCPATCATTATRKAATPTTASPNVAYWNLFCLAQALLPLIGHEDLAKQALESDKTVFPEAFTAQMRAKLGGW